jgi:hypothetical protein
MAKRVVAVLSDLIFTVKIADAGKRADVAVEFAKSAGDALQRATGAAAAILDLDFVSPELIAQLKAAGVPTIGYVSHVHTDVIQRAKESGCETVMARSAFVQKLGDLLQRL